jgi:hypothetical protein
MVQDVQAASRRPPSGIALRVADYEDASALKRALAGTAQLTYGFRKITPSDMSTPYQVHLGNVG